MTANEAVKHLRNHVMKYPAGDFLGSEDDLLAVVPVSIPTFRQAVRVLEHEQLLVAKRGAKGGYYANRPSLHTVVRSAATYLAERNPVMSDFLGVAKVLNVELCRLAALSTNGEAKARLRQVLADEWSAPFSDAKSLTQRDKALEILLLEVAGNPVLDLYMRANYEFGQLRLTTSMLENRPARMEAWRRQRLRQCEAILSGEVVIAEAYGKNHYDIMAPYIEEMLKTESQTDTP